MPLKVEPLNSASAAAVSRAQARDVVFIVVHTMTFLTELAPLGRLLRERAGVETIFYCAFKHWTADKFAESCAQQASRACASRLDRACLKPGCGGRPRLVMH